VPQTATASGQRRENRHPAPGSITSGASPISAPSTTKGAFGSGTADNIPATPAGARRLALHRLIGERGFVGVANIAREIGISDMTIRRDLEALERDGLI